MDLTDGAWIPASPSNSADLAEFVLRQRGLIQ